MIDFAALVLRPAMVAFGQPVVVTPLVSQPGTASYACRGVYASKPVQIPLENGGYHSTVQPSLGIRLVDFSVFPVEGDEVVVGMLGTFVFADVVPDGQGGADCPLRAPDVPDGTTYQVGG